MCLARWGGNATGSIRESSRQQSQCSDRFKRFRLSLFWNTRTYNTLHEPAGSNRPPTHIHTYHIQSAKSIRDAWKDKACGKSCEDHGEMCYWGYSSFSKLEISKLKIVSLLSFTQASTYGKCIVADYNAVYKDKCLTEFLRLKDCYLVSCSVAVGLPKCADLCQRLLRRPHSLQVARKRFKACRLKLYHER